jgi:RNA polymerase sigma factor (sigma-70 family)
MEVSALPHPSSISGLRGPSALLRLQSDERLIALTRRGHHAAFEVLCSRYQSRLLAFCRHMLSSKEDAEDVLQEVFTAAFNAVLADDRPINVRPWLYRIARNRSLNHLRRATATGVDSMDIHFAENGISTSDKVLRRESFHELIADVHGLPETQRTALLLREIDAMSYDQIAQAMDTTVPSVKSLLVRARISLAEAAEARKLNCDEVRLELGEVAEGLTKLSTPARRHVRDCERCGSFKKQLRATNGALAAVLPVAPLLILKKLVLAKLGMTASAGGAHVAGGAGAAAGAGATATVGAGAAAGGSGLAGGVMTAGAGALATKAAAGLAAAALVTAGAVATDHQVIGPSHHRHRAAVTAAAASASVAVAAPVVARIREQPLTVGSGAAHAARLASHKHPAKPLATATVAAPALAATPAPGTATAPATDPLAPPKPEAPQTPEQVTQVTTETTTLPTSATTPEAQPPTAGTPTTGTPPPVPPTTTETPAPAPPADAPITTPPPPPPSPVHVRHRERTGGTEAPAGALGLGSSHAERALARAARLNRG